MGRKKAEYSYLDLAKEILEASTTPLSANDIWEKGKEKGLQVDTKAANPVMTLNSSLVQDYQKAGSEFLIVSRRPVHWGLTTKEYTPNSNPTDETDKQIVKKDKTKNAEKTLGERDLHPLLVQFVRYDVSFGRCYAKTIYHENSINKQAKDQKWIHPDIVGISYPFSSNGINFGKDTLALMELLEHNECKFYSFEMKIKIETGNQLREAYFQAVSNSSWANEGYLVATEYDDNVNEEMQALNNTFGIGFIKLDVTDFENSCVLIPAKPKTELDWSMIDRLMGINPDFKGFIDNVKDDIEQKKVHREDVFDKVMEDKELKKYCRILGQKMPQKDL